MGMERAEHDSEHLSSSHMLYPNGFSNYLPRQISKQLSRLADLQQAVAESAGSEGAIQSDPKSNVNAEDEDKGRRLGHGKKVYLF